MSSSLVRLGLIAFSAGVAALVVALVLPYTDPESLAALANHPVGAKALNCSSAALYALARLLEGVPSTARGPSLRRYYPLSVNGSNAAPSRAKSRDAADRSGSAPDQDLDWADPRVWQLQQDEIIRPFYTQDDLSRLLHWCNDGDDSGGSSGSNNSIAPIKGDSGAEGGGGDSVRTASTLRATVQARFDRLVRWVAAGGGDASKVQLGIDSGGLRGLYAVRDIDAGEVALSVPLKLGLSAATFRSARVLGAPTAAWRAIEDADLFLDALVLSYEVAVHGDRSPWTDYLCLLPRMYDGLPIHVSDPWAASLVAEFPALRRLAAKRRAQLALFANDVARPTLAALPGGRTALMRLADSGSDSGSGGGGGGGGRDLWLPLWHWAYAAAKTRSVTLGTEEVRHGSGGGAAPGEELPVRLPLSMLDWVQEYGVMLPILDMANHAFDGRGANVAYQLISDASGTGLAAALVAQQPILAGQSLLFNYVSSTELEQGPACSDRWMIEYGFIPDSDSDSGDPDRDCDTFEVTAADVARAVVRLLGADATNDAAGAAAAAAEKATSILESRIAQQLHHRAKDGLPNRLEIHVRQTPYRDQQQEEEGGNGGEDVHRDYVMQRWAVLQWLKAALEPDDNDGCKPHGSMGQQQQQQGAPERTTKDFEIGREGKAAGIEEPSRSDCDAGENGSSNNNNFVSEAFVRTPSARAVLGMLLEARWEQLCELEHRARVGVTTADSSSSSSSCSSALKQADARTAAAERSVSSSSSSSSNNNNINNGASAGTGAGSGRGSGSGSGAQLLLQQGLAAAAAAGRRAVRRALDQELTQGLTCSD